MKMLSNSCYAMQPTIIRTNYKTGARKEKEEDVFLKIPAIQVAFHSFPRNV